MLHCSHALSCTLDGGSAAPKSRGGRLPDAALFGGRPAGAAHSERRSLGSTALWQPAVEPAGSMRAELQLGVQLGGAGPKS